MTDPETLDPSDWPALRTQGHRMLDDILDYIEQIRARPVWQPIPDDVRAAIREPLPAGPSDIGQVHNEFLKNILPFATGNVHPGFMGWVHGGGNIAGMLAEMLAAGLNANLGGRDHMPIEVERQITAWMRDLFGFPESASGLFVTGTSMANFIALKVARDAALGLAVRQAGIGAEGGKLRGYASAAAHGCVAQAFDLGGLGRDSLRLIPVNAALEMDVDALKAAVAADRAAGLQPFFVVGTAGSVDCGAIDDLRALAEFAAREKLWFHVDGAFGALAKLAPDLTARLDGIERAASIAFDFHKWLQVPYDAGFILVRDGESHRAAFASPAAYLRRETRGLAGGSPWPCDFGPDLSRGFRALKVWFTIKTYGTERLGRMISRSCALARRLEARIKAEPRLELLAPVALNIVCFGVRSASGAATSDKLNADIVASLHERGLAAPSTTTVNGRLAIRAAIVNHRTGAGDIDALVDHVLQLAAEFQSEPVKG